MIWTENVDSYPLKHVFEPKLCALYHDGGVPRPCQGKWLEPQDAHCGSQVLLETRNVVVGHGAFHHALPDRCDGDSPVGTLRQDGHWVASGKPRSRHDFHLPRRRSPFQAVRHRRVGHETTLVKKRVMDFCVSSSLFFL